MSIPSNYVQVSGQNQVSSDQLNTFVQSANVVTDLRAFVGLSGMKVHMTGYTTPNDGGQGFFYWNATGTGPDDGGVTNIVPTGSALGCWTRILATGVGNGTVTSVSVTNVNGVFGTVSNATTTPAISISLGAITPSSVAASGAVTGSNLSGTNTGDQTITLTGDVTGSGTGSFPATISTNVVSNSKFRQSAAISVVGNATNATANVSDITGSAYQVLTINTTGTALSFQNTLMRMGVVTDATASSYNTIATYTAGPYTLSGGASMIEYDGYTVSMPVISSTSIVSSANGVLINGMTATGTSSFGTTVGVSVGSTTIDGALVSATNVYGVLVGTAIMSNGCALTRAYGVNIFMPVLANASTLVQGYGINISSPTVPGTATISSCFGINISNQGAAGVTNSSAINIAAQSGSSSTSNAILSSGFKLDGTGKLTLSTNASLLFTTQTSGAAGNTGTLTNAPKAGNPDFWLPISINGTAGWVPWWHA